MELDTIVTVGSRNHSVAQSANSVVVGAGAAGLFSSRCLAKSGVDFVLLEQRERVAMRWGNRHDRLHLHTTKRLSAPPGHDWTAGTERPNPRSASEQAVPRGLGQSYRARR